LVQEPSERRDIAEFGVRDDGGQLQPRGAGASNEGDRLPPLLLKRDARGDSRDRPSGRILDPGLRQIQQRAEQPRAGAGPERCGHCHLAVGDLAQGATVLAGDTDRVAPLFRKAGAVEDQHPATFGQHLQQPTPDPVGIPRRMRDEVLKRLIRHRLRDTRQHRLHRFALAVAEHALHIRAQREPLRAMTEAALERLEPAHQSLNPRGGGAIEHCDAA
jgi:hypothetical protein